ncbi:MAG: hypothetical protein AB2A00_41040 [Myxococcota bacterium]
MFITSALLVLAAANPEVTRVLASIATSQGEARAHAVQGYAAGCRGKNRFAYRNNKDALEALRPTFKDEDAGVRLAALGLTACYPPDTFGPELVTLTEDKDPAVRERAYEEAAHAESTEVLLGLGTQVETCTSKLDTLDAEGARWCVFALYALAENGRAIKDQALRARIAELSAPMLTANNAKLREHALRNVDLFGTAAQVEALQALAAGDVRAGGERATDEEKKKAKALMQKVKKRKK